MLRVLLYQATSKLAASTLATKVKEMARRGLQKRPRICAICVIHLVQDNLACVRVSKDPRNPRHQLDPTPGKSGSIVQGVVEDKDEEDVELLVEGPAQGGHLDAIDGTIALAIRADQLVLFPAHVVLKRNSDKLLVSSVKLQPVVAVNLKRKLCNVFVQ